MLPNKISQTDYDLAKAELSRGRSNFTAEFDWDEDVVLPVAPSPTIEDNPKWRGITVELSAFIIGRPTPPNDEKDEPFLIAQGSTPMGPKLVRYPSGTGAAPEVEKMTRKAVGTGRTVAYHSSLDADSSARVQAQAAAYEEDFDEILNDLLGAIRSDAKSAAEFGLAQAPGLSAFGLASPSAAVTAITSLLPSFQSNQVGGDFRVLDSGLIQWYRSIPARTWTARKFSLHTTPKTAAELDDLDADEQPGWYLLEWIINLSVEPRSYETAFLSDPDRSIFLPETGLHHAAALRVARGEPTFAVAEALALPEAEVALAAAGFESLDFEGRNALVRIATLEELEWLRKTHLG